MPREITDQDWHRLLAAQFDTDALHRAITAFDELQGDFRDTWDGGPTKLRADLVRLQAVAKAVFDSDDRSQVHELFELCSDLQGEFSNMRTSLDEVLRVLTRLQALYPESFGVQD